MGRICASGRAVLVAALAAAGCGDAGDGVVRREVSGTVVLDGQPLGSGLIEFDPLENQPTRSSGQVKDGKFRLDKATGLADGGYAVRITGTGRTDPIPVPPGHVGMPVVPKEWWPVKIPDRYNKTTELKAAVTSGPNVLAFELKGGKLMEVRTPGGK